jgi:hypothetical protein
MNHLNRVISLVVLALWVSCMVRCEAATLTASNALACCSETSDDCGGTPASPGHCACDLAKFGGFISERSVVTLPLPMAFTLFELPETLEVRPPEWRPADVILSPPEFLAGWQFVYQTAAPPRAPSFIS